MVGTFHRSPVGLVDISISVLAAKSQIVPQDARAFAKPLASFLADPTPVAQMIAVKGGIDPAMLIKIEADAVIRSSY